MKSLLYTTLCSVVLILLFSCKRETAEPVALGYDYYPFREGNYVVFQVDSIVWDDFDNSVDTFQYQIKEEIGELYYDAENRASRKIKRYIKPPDSSAFYLKDVWYATRTNTKLEKVEENVRYVRLLFPLVKGKSWNGNAKNNLDSRNYEYTTAHAEEVINQISLDSVTTVLQADEKNLIEEYFAEEKYAAGIGMVYKRYRKLETEIDGTITNGVDYTMTLKSYGSVQ